MSAPAVEAALGARLLAGLETIERGQHPNGEILSYRCERDGSYAYCRSPFVSTVVHDALSCLDPGSPGWRDGSLEIVPAQAQERFGMSVARIRRRIRSFLIWQQEADGLWRFFGRGSGIDPDVATTVGAALALREGHGSRSLLRAEQQSLAIGSFRSASGPFFTFLRRGRGGYGWMDADGGPVVGFDRVVNAEVLRYLYATGSDQAPQAERLLAWLMEETARGDLTRGTPLFPNPLSFLRVLSRLLADHDLPGAGPLAERLVSALLRLQTAAGGFGGPLSTAVGADALRHLGHTGPALARAGSAVLRGLGARGGWTYEDFVIHGFGAPALTTALSLAFLARWQGLAGRATA